MNGQKKKLKGQKMINIIDKVTDYLQKERNIRPCYINNASKVGFPCARSLVYRRLNWKDQALPDTGLMYIFQEGNTHERAVVRLLLDAGIEVIESQRTLDWPDIQASGHIDGQVKVDGESMPIEIKSSNQFTWEKLNSQEDLKASDKIWVKNWYGQLQLYLWMMSQPRMILLLKNKQSGQLKQVDITIDMDYSDKLVKKLLLVNEHVAAETYPDRISDRTICQYCDFRHICLPDEDSEQIEITDNPELLELLEERESLKQPAKDYEAVDKKLKEYWKRTESGTYLVGGKFQVKLSMYKRTIYTVPPEIKEQYKDSMEYSRATITAIR